MVRIVVDLGSTGSDGGARLLRLGGADFKLQRFRDALQNARIGEQVVLDHRVERRCVDRNLRLLELRLPLGERGRDKVAHGIVSHRGWNGRQRLVDDGAYVGLGHPGLRHGPHSHIGDAEAEHGDQGDEEKREARHH
jgi:hypothetical protein